MLKKAMGDVIANQDQLVHATDLHDVQFLCTTRVLMNAFKDLAAKLEELIPGSKIELPTLATMNRTFAEFEAFRRIPDYREHIQEWLNGTSLGDLMKGGEIRDRQRHEALAKAQAAALEKVKAEEEQAKGQVQEAAPEVTPPVDEDPTRHPEGATFYGGDDVTSANGNSEQAESQPQVEAGPAVEVPSVQDHPNS